jgi:hypothetical protein
MEYESVIQNFSLCIESTLRNAKQLQHARLCFVSGFKTIGHGNPDNNLESLCALHISIFMKRSALIQLMQLHTFPLILCTFFIAIFFCPSGHHQFTYIN